MRLTRHDDVLAWSQEMSEIPGLSPVRRVMVAVRHARHLLDLGHVAEARVEYQRAYDLNATVGDALAGSMVAHGLAVLGLVTGDDDAMNRWGAEALALARAHRSPGAISTAYNSLGCAAHTRGELGLAEKQYQAALHYENLAGTYGSVVEANLTQVIVERGEYALALPLVARLARRASAVRNVYMTVFAVVLRWCCYAGLADWGQWDATVFLLERDLHLLRNEPLPTARMTRLCGDVLANAGQSARARRAWRISLAMWRAYGQAEPIAGVEHRLATGEIPP
jgi:hypothetical protein